MPTPCPSGAMSATAGAKEQEDCGHCPPGRWCKAGELLLPVFVCRLLRGVRKGRK